jgi:hypothetical protein
MTDLNAQKRAGSNKKIGGGHVEQRENVSPNPKRRRRKS